MMKLDPILTKAVRFARKGKYNEAIRVLEPEVVRYHDSFRYYYILAVSYLHTKDFGGALTYFKRAREIKMRDPQALLGLAVLYLRRGDSGRAVDFYLEVQEIQPKNKTAKKALNIIRKHSDSESLALFNDSGKIKSLFPPFPDAPLSPSDILLSALSVAGGLGLIFFILLLSGVFSSRDSDRAGFTDSALERTERTEPVQVGGSFRFVLTRQQILDDYEKGRIFFTERRDEAARLELNRILESNASESIKNKARMLISFIDLDVPGFDTLKDRFSFVDVCRDPIVYRNCHVIWRGMATNLQMEDNTTSFDLLVGYDTRNTLEGIVPVHFDFSIPVNLASPLEVLGRIVPSSAVQGAGLYLEGVAIHQASSLGGRRQ